ncbi:MAG TPA: sugar ABC transporter permease [Candidatus Dormibacteraeota bacterium]|nr:sugar ABC transporter permease [Candidatus Dormibacteraeota bacterium]
MANVTAATEAGPTPALRRRPGPGREAIYAYLTLLPVLLVVAAFSLYPILYAAYLSLHKELLTDPGDHHFVGFGNYADVFHSFYLVDSVTSTLVFVLMSVPAVMVFGLLVALLLNQAFAGAGILRVAVLLPWALPPVVSGIIWRWILNDDYGVLNSILRQLSIVHYAIPWLSNPQLARVALVFAQVWHEGPLAAIFLLAGLRAIPAETYGAARVDGAGWWAIFRHITLPLLRAPLLLVLIYETIVAAVTFDLVYIMTGGGPANATALVSWFAYTEVFKFVNLGNGSALAFLIAAALLVIILGYLRALRVESNR